MLEYFWLNSSHFYSASHNNYLLFFTTACFKADESENRCKLIKKQKSLKNLPKSLQNILLTVGIMADLFSIL